MKQLFFVANVVAGLLALLAAFSTLETTSFGVNQITRVFIAIAIGAICLWMAKQSNFKSDPQLP
jgi:hypothetical protein